jgi:hypothetical protein
MFSECLLLWGHFIFLKVAISFTHDRYLLPTWYLLGIKVKINKNPPGASHSVKPLAAGPYSSQAGDLSASHSVKPSAAGPYSSKACCRRLYPTLSMVGLDLVQ